jgi:hypothetical protein
LLRQLALQRLQQRQAKLREIDNPSRATENGRGSAKPLLVTEPAHSRLALGAGRPTATTNEEDSMADTYGSGPRLFYAVIIRDKCKTADHATLQAYKTVGHDLLKDHHGPEAEELKKALGDLDKTLAGKN